MRGWSKGTAKEMNAPHWSDETERGEAAPASLKRRAFATRGVFEVPQPPLEVARLDRPDIDLDYALLPPLLVITVLITLPSNPTKRILLMRLADEPAPQASKCLHLVWRSGAIRGEMARPVRHRRN